MDHKVEIKEKDWKFYKEMHQLMDGGLSFTFYTSCPECEFEHFANRYGTEILDGIHLHGYMYSPDSRLMKSVMDICKKYNVFFIMEPRLKGPHNASMFKFSFVPPKNKKGDKD